MMDIAKLKELALAAMQDQWEMIDQGGQFGLRVHSGYQGFFNKQRPNVECAVEVINTCRFIEAASPATIFELSHIAESAKSGTFQADIKRMVDRFLGWSLPSDFSPDCGISFKRLEHPGFQFWPTGTNLLTANQAEAMFRYVLESNDKPAGCRSDPSNCPDNEGYGCACTPTNKESLTVAAEAQGKLVTIAGPELFDFLREWAHMPEGERFVAANKIIAHIDAHVARAVVAAVDGATKDMVPLSADARSVFLDGFGLLDIVYPVGPQQSAHRYIRPDEVCIVGRQHDGKSPDIDLPIFRDGSKDGKRMFLVALPAPQQHAQAAQYQVCEIGESDWRNASKEEYERCQRAPEMDTRIAGNAQAAQLEQIEIDGCGSMTDEGDGLLTLRFVNEQAAQQFMMAYMPSVNCIRCNGNGASINPDGSSGIECSLCKGTGEGWQSALPDACRAALQMLADDPDVIEVITRKQCRQVKKALTTFGKCLDDAQAALSDGIHRALDDARTVAMKNAAEARIPECGDFASIAQNLDWAINQIAASQQPAAAPAQRDDALSQAFEDGKRLAHEQACRVTHALMAEREAAFQQGRAAGLKEAAKWIDQYHGIGRREAEAIRALAAKPAEMKS